MRRIVPLLVLPLLLAACGEGRPPVVGEAVPAYGARLVSGDSVSLAGLRGAPVLLNVWATWCHPCREEMPALQRVHERWGDRGLRVVGVSIDGGMDGAEVEAFARDLGARFPIWLDPQERVTNRFGTTGVPTTFLIGPDGTLLWKRIGPVHDDDPEMAERIEAALSSSAS